MDYAFLMSQKKKKRHHRIKSVKYIIVKEGGIYYMAMDLQTFCVCYATVPYRRARS